MLISACSCMLMAAHEHSWALMSPHKPLWSLMANTNEHSWTCRYSAITTHSTFVPYFSALISVHDGAWVLLSAHEYSWIILSVQVLDSEIKKNVDFQNDFQYFGHICVKISPNNDKFDSFDICTDRTVKKCPKWTL